MYKEDLALNNLQWLISHKTKPDQTKPNHIYLIYMYKEDLAFNKLQWLICHKTKPNQSSKKEGSGYEIKLDLVVRSPFWISEEYGVTISLPLLQGSLWTGVIVYTRLPFKGQIGLFENCLYHIGTFDIIWLYYDLLLEDIIVYKGLLFETI